MRRFAIFILASMSLLLSAADIPLIFVHGHKSSARPMGPTPGHADHDYGLETWYPLKNDGSLEYSTAMTKIVKQRYSGYRYGLKSDGKPAIDCDKNTVLQSMPDSKRIYNFSYYHPSGQRGVISYSDESVLVYIKWLDDKAGRYRPTVIAPFNPNYPPADYDSTTYYPKYIPHLIMDVDPDHGLVWFAADNVLEYVKSWKKGKFAERLAEFIDKVLSATGASKVDIVAHSMGGLVSRAAIKNYGCSSKVRKLIMVGTPNHPYNCWWEELYQVFSGDQSWQKRGENLEMGVAWGSGENAHFVNLENAYEDQWGNLLGYDNHIENMATIAGNKGKSYFGDAPNDGVTAVNQVRVNSAQFNPVIYASHSYEDISEQALPTCTYTTEFIKKWMIDDEIPAR